MDTSWTRIAAVVAANLGLAIAACEGEPPGESSTAVIEVAVDGTPVYGVWSYDTEDKAVVFDDSDEPSCGEEIVVNYVPVGDCS